MIAAPEKDTALGDSDERPSRAAWFLLAVLTLAYTVSFIDRQILNLLVQPLKAQFSLDDTRLSLLQGVAFTTAYIVFSPLFGRAADVASRRNTLMTGIGVWSLATSACGLARSYWQLFLARFAVGGAEASLTPSAWSMIADSFPARSIPTAFSIFMMGPYLGGGIALIFGGLLLDASAHWNLDAVPLLGALKPWQVVFLMVGAPGMVVALLLTAVREPRRRESKVVGQQGKMPLREVWRFFVEWRGFYGNFYIGMPCLIISLYAYPAWMPALLMRRFAVSAGQVGLQYGTIVLITGSLGVLTGPWLARLIERRGRREALLIVPLGVAFALALVSLGLGFTHTYASTLAVATLASFTYSLPQALASSALQIVTPNRMRGLASAIYVFVVSVVGLGAAPTIVALLTDHLFHDEKRVGDALMVTCVGSALIAAFFLWRTLRSYRLMMSRG